MTYSDLFSCKDKIAVVTGGAGLIGREIVRGLSEFGAITYIADIDEGKASATIQTDNVKYIRFDITSESSIAEALDTVHRREGRIDILVNCAYPRTGDWGARFEKVPFNSWKKNIDDHLGGYFLTCRKAADHMMRQQGGAIINLASIYGNVAPDFSIYEGTEMTMPVAYSAIKGGIIALTKYIATYYGQYNVRANTVSPGGIFDNQQPSFVEKYSKKTPLGRMARPEEIVGAVIYLASGASSYVTGHDLIVDGGWTAW